MCWSFSSLTGNLSEWVAVFTKERKRKERNRKEIERERNRDGNKYIERNKVREERKKET